MGAQKSDKVTTIADILPLNNYRKIASCDNEKSVNNIVLGNNDNQLELDKTGHFRL